MKSRGGRRPPGPQGLRLNVPRGGDDDDDDDDDEWRIPKALWRIPLREREIRVKGLLLFTMTLLLF